MSCCPHPKEKKKKKKKKKLTHRGALIFQKLLQGKEEPPEVELIVCILLVLQFEEIQIFPLAFCGAFGGKETMEISRTERGRWKSSSPYFILFILG